MLEEGDLIWNLMVSYLMKKWKKEMRGLGDKKSLVKGLEGRQ